MRNACFVIALFALKMKLIYNRMSVEEIKRKDDEFRRLERNVLKAVETVLIIVEP